MQSATPNQAPYHEQTPSLGALPSALQVGTLVSRRYLILQMIRTDDCGVYFLARDLQSRRTCSLKFGPRQCLLHDAEISARLSHPGLFEPWSLESFGESHVCLVGETLAGPDVSYFQLPHRGVTALSSVIELLDPVVAALTHAHQHGVVHRDIRPRRILVSGQISAQPGSTSCKLSGFHYAKLGASSSVGMRIGEPDFLSPEATLPDRGQVDEQSDEWSLAAMIYFLISGALPFSAPDPFEQLRLIRHAEPLPLDIVLPYVPQQVSEVVARGLAKAKRDRYPSVAAFWGALRAATKREIASPQVLPLELTGPIILSGMHESALASGVRSVPLAS